nr:MAG TPA: hypothetical protein [Caudoviricetes sp.]
MNRQRSLKSQNGENRKHKGIVRRCTLKAQKGTIVWQRLMFPPLRALQI